MKIRKGFVSNSSSSSFVCDICQHDVSGMDMGLEDAGMYECMNDHTFCDSHAENILNYYNMDLKEKKKYCLKLANNNDFYQVSLTAIQNGDELDEFYADHFEGCERYGLAAEYCPCCELTSPTNGQILEFMFHDNNITKEEIVLTMKNKYGNYNNMLEKINK